MKIIKCVQSDLDKIIKLGRQTYFDTFYSLNIEETMTTYLNEAFNPDKIKEELANPNSSFYFLVDNIQIAGYIKTNLPPSQTDINDPHSIELERIYVKKEYIGKGCGKVLMNKAFSLAKKHSCKYIWLGVWEKNASARAFYEKMGFHAFSGHQFRMGDELQNDVIYKKEFH